MTKAKQRCAWLDVSKDYYVAYHDHEWGVPVHDDRTLFEMIILEGAQAGLSWSTVLKKREGYRKAFKNFDVKKCAKLTDDELEKILLSAEIVRNRLKVFSVRKNAIAFIAIQKEFGSFDAYLWSFVNGKPVQTKRETSKDVPVTTPQSDALSKDLKKRGMTFVGSTIMQAYMQAVGLFNDHTKDCFRQKLLS